MNYATGGWVTPLGGTALGQENWLASLPTPPAVDHPSHLSVFHLADEDVWSDGPWHWQVWHRRDRGGVRAHVVTRWGGCNRWEDALAGGLLALTNQHREEQS